MLRRSRPRWLLTCYHLTLWACVAHLLGGVSAAQTPPAPHPLNAPGLHSGRGHFSVEPWEQIDTYSGGATIVLPSIVLPGDAGFDLQFTNMVSTKAGAAVGGFGPESVTWSEFRPQEPNPIIRDGTGTEHHTFATDVPGVFRTNQLWLYTEPESKLELPNGTTYYFGWGVHLRRVSQIRDRYNNVTDIEYVEEPAGSGIIARKIFRQWVQGQQRLTELVYDGPRLTAITTGGRTWEYHWTGDFLSLFVPPEGPAWQLSYEGSGALTTQIITVTTPTGGWVRYEPERLLVPETNGQEYTYAIRYRRSGGPAVQGGTWRLDYELQFQQCTVTGPDGRREYSHHFAGPTPVIGRIQTFEPDGSEEEGRLLEDRTFAWDSSTAAGTPDPYYVNTYPNDFLRWPNPTRPLPGLLTTKRDGKEYRTQFEYRDSDLKDYQNPWRVTEFGDFNRVTTYGYRHAFGNLYLRGAVESVAVSSQGETFSTTQQLDGVTGFVRGITQYGVTTTFAPDPHGNVASITDANAHTTSFAYAWGAVRQIATPAYSITRTINTDGTVKDETRRGFKTSFEYDGLGRERRRTPPLGHATLTDYSPDERTVTASRGTFWERTDLDGFGRLIKIEKATGSKVTKTYDAAGRMTFDSRPFYGAAGHGVSMTYDALGRVRSATDSADGSRTEHAYWQNTVTSTDALDKDTTQTWHFAGASLDGRLASVYDAESHTTSYGYDALGSLTSVTGPGGEQRSWHYNPRHQLESETHPESGQTTYTYDAAGLMWTRTEATGLVTEFSYDHNNRLREVRPIGQGGQYLTTFTYDDSDNRKTAVNGWVASSFDYDEANRLRRRTDVILGQTYVTDFTPDDHDNVREITYPARLPGGARRVVRYDYVANRVSKVYEPDGRVYADQIQYEASDALRGYNSGNGLPHAMTEDNRGRPRTVSVGAFLGLTYDYDLMGNVIAIRDGRTGYDQAFPLYDNLHRLRRATGPWGEVQFTYSASGNRETKTLNGAETVYTTHPTTQRLEGTSGAQAEAFLYWPNGGVRQDGLGSYTYTPMGMLARAALSAGLTMDFGYDADAMRKVRAWSGQDRHYVHGPGGVLLTEYQRTGTGAVKWLRDYIYLGTRAIASVSSGPSVAFTSASSTVAEPGTASIAVVLTTPDGGTASQAVVATYSTANGSATAGADYTAAPAGSSVTFPAGSANGSTQTILVPVLHDVMDEADETFLVQLAGSGAGTHTVTITDNDPPPALSVHDVSLAEGQTGTTPFNVTVSLNGLSGRPVSFTYATAAGTASAGVDFTPVSGTATIAPGAPSVIVPVPVVGDTLIEGDETFTVTIIGEPSNATIADGQGLGTIINDDTRRQWYFAEGSTGHGLFDQDLLVVNPHATVSANLTIQYRLPNGTSVPQSVTVPPQRRHTIRVDSVPGVTSTDNAAFVSVTTGADVVVERAMYWSNAEQRGGHHALGARAPAIDWYFAEGYTGFETYLTLANPHASQVTVDVTYYVPNRESQPTVVSIGPYARHTVWVNGVVGAGLDVSARVHARTLPIVAERAIYWNNWEGGHVERGITEPRTRWLFAEGTVRTAEYNFETYLLLWNPGSVAAVATVRFMQGGGQPVVTKTYPLAPGRRQTVAVGTLPEFPGTHHFATQVDSDQPIVAERAMYWSNWVEGHAAMGNPDPALQWWFADGAQGTVDGLPRDTFLLVFNPQPADLALRATFFREGEAPVIREYTVGAQRRFTLHAGSVPELASRRFGVTLEAITTPTVPVKQPFVAERAVYWGTGWYGAHASAGSPSSVQ